MSDLDLHDEQVGSPLGEPTVWTKAGNHFVLDRMSEDEVRDLVFASRVAPVASHAQQWITLQGTRPRKFTLILDLKEIEAVTWFPVITPHHL